MLAYLNKNKFFNLHNIKSKSSYSLFLTGDTGTFGHEFFRVILKDKRLKKLFLFYTMSNSQISYFEDVVKIYLCPKNNIIDKINMIKDILKYKKE